LNPRLEALQRRLLRV